MFVVPVPADWAMELAAPGHIMVEPTGQSLVNWIPGDVITKSHRQGGLKQQKSVFF